MTDRLALPRRYRDQLEALLREHVPGVEVWAYGSRVNGESHDGSDLDLALRGPALEPLDGGFNDLLEAIEKSTIPILVQAHDWARLPESFHREIERDYVVVQEGAKQTAANSWREVALGDAAMVLAAYGYVEVRGSGSPSTSRPWRVTSSEWSGHGWTRCWSHRLPWRPLPPLHEATGAVASPLMPTRTGYGAPQRPHRPQHKPRPEQTQSLA